MTAADVEIVEGQDLVQLVIEGMEKQEGAQEGDMEPWVVIVDSPYAGYLEFGSAPARSKPKGTTPRGKEDRSITAVNEAFRRWAESKGKDAAYGDRIYRKVMREGMLPNPYLRPAMYHVMHILEKNGEWNGPVTLHAIADRIAEEAEDIVRDFSMGAGMEPYGHLADAISVVRSDEVPSIGQADGSQVTPDLWTESRRNDGILGKTARNPRLGR